jgi:hypothetical protein
MVLIEGTWEDTDGVTNPLGKEATRNPSGTAGAC